jgi:hypothetical protein
MAIFFRKIFPELISPMRADKSALETMPTMAYRYCEPMRSASSHGWYIFPPLDFSLRWDGHDVYFYDSDSERWIILDSYLPDEHLRHWNAYCPKQLKNLCPPLITALPMRGVVQVWSGLFCESSKDWSVLVRPLVNVRSTNAFSCFEGIVETDEYKPFPLFVNLQLIATNIEINIAMAAPLFQLVPLKRECYSDEIHDARIYQDGLLDKLETEKIDWNGFIKTVRVSSHGLPAEPGTYAIESRKRNKRFS